MIERIDAVAERMETNRAAVIRFCVNGFLNHVETHGGVICLPANWDRILKELDGRYRGEIADSDRAQVPPESKTQKAAEQPKSPYGKAGSGQTSQHKKASKARGKDGAVASKPGSRKRSPKKKQR